MNKGFICNCCKKNFKSQRSFSCHIAKSICCQTYMQEKLSQSQYTQDETSLCEDNDMSNINFHNETTMEEDAIEFPPNCDPSLLQQYIEHEQNKQNQNTSDDILTAASELLHLLNLAKAPLYLFDEIIKWIKRSIYKYNIDFKHVKGFSRKIIIEKGRNKFDMKGLLPSITKVHLTTTNEQIDVVIHDFKQCLYSLLTDDHLMKPENLILSDDNQLSFVPSKRYQIIDDIHTGKCYKMAYQKYIQNPDQELLCPIIFFIDKTHTDIHGRLCLEPVQFTLGIFNRDTRDKAKSWRTLGYIPNIPKNPNDTTEQRLQDYHSILSKILESFNNAQNNPIIWKFKLPDGLEKFYALKIPVLFIIGDTEGHDKLCGRYSFRKNPKKLCRYCDVPYEDTDNPYVEFNYLKQRYIQRLITRQDKISLQQYSMHCVTNAWHNIDFCDSERGIHGATLAEVLHCIQHGLLEYAIMSFFDQKKILKFKKKSNIEQDIDFSDESFDDSNDTDSSNESLMDVDDDNDFDSLSSYGDFSSESDGEEDDHEELSESGASSSIDSSTENATTKIHYSRNYVFSQKYAETFNKLCIKQGKILQQQSDRNKPRTHFSTSYISISKKNGHEIPGLLLVYIFLLTSDEGHNILSIKLGQERLASFIHCFEILLLLENFCKIENHHQTDLSIMKSGIPAILDFVKNTLNRTKGNGMKIIKYHLCLHFVDDVRRFGSMPNYDSCIGERHHCTEVKNPAKRTQRRKLNFDYQTAKQQVDNILIHRLTNLNEKHPKDRTTFDNELTKKCNIVYDRKSDQFLKKNNVSKKYEIFKDWKDQYLFETLKKVCKQLVDDNKVVNPIQFYTEHKHDNFIVRGNPCYVGTQPWYDWVYVDWNTKKYLPSKTCIFMDLSYSFLNSFEIGGSLVNEPGKYAIGFSCDENVNEMSHPTSILITKYKLLTHQNGYDKELPILTIFPIESIADACIAVPFHVKESIINAIEWSILQPRMIWNDILIDFLKNGFDNE